MWPNSNVKVRFDSVKQGEAEMEAGGGLTWSHIQDGTIEVHKQMPIGLDSTSLPITRHPSPINPCP